MNKVKTSGRKWSIPFPQQPITKATRVVGIDIHKMAEDAARIREQKANAVRTSELSGLETVEPTGLFTKRTSRR